MFYVAPLTTLAQVVRTRDSSSLHPPLCVMNLINGTTWGSYGYFAISDPYLAAPNGIGALLGIVQCMLCVCLPRVAERERRARSQTTKVDAAIPGLDGTSSIGSSSDSKAVSGLEVAG